MNFTADKSKQGNATKDAMEYITTLQAENATLRRENLVIRIHNYGWFAFGVIIGAVSATLGWFVGGVIFKAF